MLLAFFAFLLLFHVPSTLSSRFLSADEWKRDLMNAFQLFAANSCVAPSGLDLSPLTLGASVPDYTFKQQVSITQTNTWCVVGISGFGIKVRECVC